MRVIDLENINYAMRSETQFVLRCEEVFHDKISAAATTILSNKGEKPLVALTGPSASRSTCLTCSFKRNPDASDAMAIFIQKLLSTVCRRLFSAISHNRAAFYLILKNRMMR